MRQLLYAACLVAAPLAAQGDSALVVRARAIHDRVMTLDTHVDINPANFTAERNYTQRLPSQVNLPKMEEGGLDAVFLVVYVGAGATTPPRVTPARTTRRSRNSRRFTG